MANKTRKLNLDRTYIYNGITYGPGVVEVPEGEVADAIQAKQTDLQSKGVGATAVSSADEQARPSIEQLPTGQQNPGAGDTTIASRGGEASPGTVALTGEQADNLRQSAENAQTETDEIGTPDNGANQGQPQSSGDKNATASDAKATDAKGTEVTTATTPGHNATKVSQNQARSQGKGK